MWTGYTCQPVQPPSPAVMPAGLKAHALSRKPTWVVMGRKRCGLHWSARLQHLLQGCEEKFTDWIHMT